MPRGLFFHLFNDGWVTFFEELGFKVKVTGPSNKEVLNEGTKLALSETCLPVKFYYGHVLELADKVDYIFVPRLVSINKKEFLCPRFMGLPDTVEQNISDLPPLIVPTINYNNKETWKSAALEVGNQLNIPYIKCYKAFLKASLKHKQTIKNQQAELKDKLNKDNKKIALIGRDYIINDEITGIGIQKKIEGAGYDIITSNMIGNKDIDEGNKHIDKKLYWTLNRRLFGSALYLANNGFVDGIVQVITFGCGPDSIVCELIERKVKQISSIPNLTLTLDEHTGEAGMFTRLEAFMDLLERRITN
nr:acyl-CoA dehydratase activase-related protein [Natranaerofaba carboxydovora]